MVEQKRAVNRKARVGTVVSDRASQTIVVAVERASRHRLYRKVIRRTKRYHVHDPENAATTGDVVRIEECRPISKTKRWRLVEVLTERAVAEVAPETIDQTLVAEVQRTAARAAAEEASAAEDSESTSQAAGEASAAPSGDEPAAEDDSGSEGEPATEDGEQPQEEPAASEEDAPGDPEVDAEERVE